MFIKGMNKIVIFFFISGICHCLNAQAINNDLPLAVQQNNFIKNNCTVKNENQNRFLSDATLHSNPTSQSSIMYQANYEFYDSEDNQPVKWQGDVNAMFVDELGRIREDSNSDLKLSDDDYIIDYIKISGEDYFTRSYLHDESLITIDFEFTLDQLKPIWRASDFLNNEEFNYVNQRNYNHASFKRYLFSYIDSQMIDFVASQALMNFSEKFNINGADFSVSDIINYVRGENIESARNRDGNVLGDIVNSNVQLVSSPKSIELLKLDDSYQLFLDQYKNRRNMLYVGANDGVLHGFNAGFTDTSLSQINNGAEDFSNYMLGSEIWGFIPESVFPKLQYLMMEDYEHHYFVDGKIQSYDVKIFNDDDTHPNGWGTILVFGLGKADQSDPNLNLISSYYILDVTDPEISPVVLDVISNDLFNSSDSSLKLIKKKVGDSIEWQLMFTSSPKKQEDNETQYANPYVFLYDLKSKKIEEYELPISNAIVADFSLADLDLDGFEDVAYLAINQTKELTEAGQIMRFHLDDYSSTDFIKFDAALTHAPLIHNDYFNQTWLFQGTGKRQTINKNTAQTNYFVGIKEPIDESLKYSFDSVAIDNLIETTNIKVLSNGSLNYANASVLKDDFDNEVVTSKQLMQFIQTKSGWKLKLNENDTLSMVLNSPVLNQQTLIIDQFLPSVDLCQSKGKSILTFVDFRLGVAGFDFKSNQLNTSVIVGNENVNSDDEVVINEIQLLSVSTNSAMLNYTQNGVQIITNNESGPVFSNFIEPVKVGPKRLGWEQLY